MKILIFSPEIHRLFTKQTAGGSETQLLRMGEELSQQHEIIFFTAQTVNPSTTTNQFQFITFSTKNRLLKYIEVALKLLWVRPQVIINRLPHNLCLPLMLYAKLKKAKLLFFSGNDEDFSPSNRVNHCIEWIIRATLQQANTIFAQNTYQLQTLKQNYGLDGILFRNAIKINTEKPIPLSQRPLQLIWVGRLTPIKRPDRIFEIAKQLPNMEIKIIGPIDPDDSYIVELMKRSKDIPNISWIGQRQNEELQHDYSQARGLLNTSECEGLPNTFLEAWNYGCPVYTLGIDIDTIIKDSNGTLGNVFQSEKDLCDNLKKISLPPDQSSMLNYLKENHDIRCQITKLVNYF